MLFKVIKDKDVFELNPELRAVGEFQNLTERQMTYVILAFDYRSPFRKLPPEERRKMAAVEAGYKYERGGKRLDVNGRNIVDGKVEAVEKAKDKYMAIQRNEDYDTLLGLSSLIADIRELNIKPNKTIQEIEKAVKFSKDLPSLMKAKRELEDIIEMREDEITDIGPSSPAEEEVVNNLSILAQLNDELDD